MRLKLFSSYRARFHTHKSKKQHLTIYKFDLPFSSLNLIYKQIICNLPIWKIQPLSDVFLFKKLLLVSYFPHFCPHFGPGKSLVTQLSKTNSDQCFFFFFFFFFGPLAPLPPFKLAGVYPKRLLDWRLKSGKKKWLLLKLKKCCTHTLR